MKIIYFDYWTKGIHHFKPIDIELKHQGHETLLLHIGSFRGESHVSETIDGIRCRDISSYNTKLIYRMLELEKPDVIITLNTTLLFDRVVAMSCRKLNIKTIFVMHGNISFGNSTQLIADIFDRSLNKFTNRMNKFWKYFWITIPNYIYSLYKCSPEKLISYKFIKILYSYMVNPGKSLFYPVYPDELLQDKCLVYSNNEITYYNSLGYNISNIHVVGNPKYNNLLEIIHGNKFHVDYLPSGVKDLVLNGEKYALFLDEGFPEVGNYGGISNEDRNNYINDIAERLNRENIHLVVKLHPCTIRDNIKVNNEILICTDALDPLINYSEFCISYISTAINNCVLLNKPVIQPSWSKYWNMPKFFVDIGVSNLWNNIAEGINTTINDDTRRKYVEEYITVTTPNIINNIINIINSVHTGKRS